MRGNYIGRTTARKLSIIMKTLKAELTGIRPLIMHSAVGVDPSNKSVREISRLAKEVKKVKSDPDRQAELREQICRLEWELSAYWNEGGFYLPGDNLFRAITEGARKQKNGKAVEAGLLPIEDAQIKTPKAYPLKLDELYKDEAYQFRYPVRVPPKTGARLIKVRAKIPTGWKAVIVLEFDDDLSIQAIKEAFETAGRLIGLGDWRPKFGRFIVKWL